MDQIIIEDLEVFANHGVLEEETRLGQKFLVSVTMNTDFSGSSTTDDLNNTVNYADVGIRCHKLINILCYIRIHQLLSCT